MWAWDGESDRGVDLPEQRTIIVRQLWRTPTRRALSQLPGIDKL